jgi:hypothetical protein
MLKTTSLRNLLKLVRFEFRRFGYRVDGEPIIKGRYVEFDYEPATGQAAFSQHAVQPCLRVFGVEEDMTLDTEIAIDTVITLGVSYKHVDSGGNGYTVRYEIKCLPFMNEPYLKRTTQF